MVSRLARGLAAQAWCANKNTRKEMDGDLAEAMAEILDRESNKARLGLATTRELLAEITARCEVNGTIDYKTVQGI